MNTARWCIALGAAYGLLGVLSGAFGAHALAHQLPPDNMAVYRTAVEYQFWHALALLAVGLLARQRQGRALQLAGWGFGLGVPLFCGSLYALALKAPPVVGAVTPVGGLLFLLGWAALVVAALRR